MEGEMTRELQQAMARYEEARGRYRQAVLSSLNGDARGEVIRDAITAYRSAREELARHGPLPSHEPRNEPRREVPGPWRFVRRLLTAS
jgi:hypothetical protein